MAIDGGILNRQIDKTPVAVIDLETTGLTPGIDRVVEVSVVRVEPGRKPYIAFDTLVNPQQRVTATEIHGITDRDVRSAPTFTEIAGDIVDAVSGCVIAAYNVYFDIKFLGYELERAGVSHLPPHFCLMYMRPLLELGPRCNLGQACRAHNIEQAAAHIAAFDAQASAKLLACYFEVMAKRRISTYAELSRRKSYKFLKSFVNEPFSDSASFSLCPSKRVVSRVALAPAVTVDPQRLAIQEYWDALCTVLADLEITDEEQARMIEVRHRLKMPKEQVRMLHAKAFASVICQFIEDRWLDDKEISKLRRFFSCLSKLGWAPGE